MKVWNNIFLTSILSSSLAFAACTANVDMGSNSITNLSDPTAASDAANKNYVDTALAGVDDSNDSWTMNGSNVVVSSGNVGIGTSDPEVKLNIVNSSSSTRPIMISNSLGNEIFNIYEDNNNDGTLFLKDSSATNIRIESNGDTFFNGGNLGIGTTNPTGKIHIYADINDTLISKFDNIASKGRTLVSLGNDVSSAFFQVSSTDFNLSGGGFEMLSNNSATIGANSGIDQFNIGLSANQPIVFFNGGWSETNEKMRINGDGNVGIGTTEPVGKLHVNGLIWADRNVSNNYGTIYAMNSSTSSSAAPGFAFAQVDTSGNLKYPAKISSYRIDDNLTASRMTFSVTSNSTTDEILSLVGDQENNGKVGIGRTNPETILHVDAKDALDIDLIDNNSSNTTTAWNQNGVKFQTLNSSLNIIGSGQVNDRKFIIQAGHSSSSYASVPGSIAMNPFGGSVGIGGHPSSVASLDVKADFNATSLRIGAPSRFLDISNQPSRGYDGGLHRFHVHSTVGAFKFSNNLSTLLFLDSNGNIGIGTENPIATLHVKSTSSTYVQAETNSNALHGFVLKDSSQQWNLVSEASSDDFKIRDVTNSIDSLVIEASTGNMSINSLEGSYTGGSAYVCVNDSGTIYASETACP